MICCLRITSYCIAYILSSSTFYSFMSYCSLICICLSRFTWSVWLWVNPLKWYGLTLWGASIETSVAGFSVMKSVLFVNSTSIFSAVSQSLCILISLSFFCWAKILLTLSVSSAAEILALLWALWVSPRVLLKSRAYWSKAAWLSLSISFLWAFSLIYCSHQSCCCNCCILYLFPAPKKVSK